MRYFGGKAAIAAPLSEFIASELMEGQVFADLFCGSCNVVSRIYPDRLRLASDLQEDLVLLFKALQAGWVPPEHLGEQEYRALKAGPPSPLRAFAGFGCSFSGKWFGGYARDGSGRNYAGNARNSLLKRARQLQGVEFSHTSYHEAKLPKGSYIYCDIPYQGTTGYSTGVFDHAAFYAWALTKASEGHTVRVSEYESSVPKGFEVVWRIGSKQSIRDGLNTQRATQEVLIKPSGYN